MNFYVFLKVFADINLYFGCIGALPALFPYRFLFLWPSLACAACAGIAAFLSDQGRNAARYPFLVLAATTLLLGAGIMDLLVLIPPVVYVMAMILRDEWSLEYFHFREGFRRTLIIMGIALVVVHFGVLIESRSDHTRVLSSAALLRHVVIYTLCGIILQRQLRLGGDDLHSRYLNTLQLGLLTVSTGAIVLAIVLSESFLSSRGLSLGQVAGSILQLLVSAPLAVLNRFFIELAEMVVAMMNRFAEPDNTASDVEPLPKMPMEEMQQLVEDTPQEPAAFPWWLAVLLLAVFTCILVLLSKALRSHRTEPDRTETEARISPKPKERQAARRSNRSKLRKVYREYLKTEKRKGHKLESFHTSRDILEGTSPSGNAEAAADLRNLYLSARYNLNRDITAEQVQSAKNALKEYKMD